MQDKHFFEKYNHTFFVQMNIFIHLDTFCAFFNNVYLYRMQ